VKVGKREPADLASLVLGVGLGLTIAIFIQTLTASDLNGVYPIITSISRLFALVGTYLALVGLVLISRIAWVEKSVGHDRLVTWHRKLGPYSLFLITFHVFFVTLGYAGNDQITMAREMWNLVLNFPWMLPALVGFLFYIAAGISSYKKVRAKISYETWWTIHLYTYLGVALSFMHQILTGSMFIDHPLNKLFWQGIYIAVAFVLVWWRFILPNARSLRRGLRVVQVVVEGPGVISIIMKGRNLDKLKAQGGQFFGWRFLASAQWWISHPYSLSAAPSNDYLRVTVKNLGQSSSALAYLKPGTRVFFEGPYGTFVASKASRGHVLLVGGGVGITPIRALLDELDPTKEIDVLYRASRDEDILLRKELDVIAKKIGARIHYLVGPRSLHPMDAKYISKLVPAFKDCDVFICGPAPLVDAVRKAAQESGIPKNRFHDEAFAFHGE
jgi:predicted ferric reductase